MGRPTVASKTPFPVDVEAGRTDGRCACCTARHEPPCDRTQQRL